MSAPTPPHVPPGRGPAWLEPRWRRDFPVEIDRDEHVTRREFTKFMILVSGAFALGQLWIALRSLLVRRRGFPRRQVARLADVPIGGAVTFEYPGEGDACLLLRPAEGAPVAFGQECTHLACAVQPELAVGRLKCPCHRGFFDAATGRPLQGPPRRPLPRIVLEVEGDVVYATGVELRT